MSRVPLSDESLDLDDDVVEEEGTVGAEEQYAELDFDERFAEREYEPEPSDEEDLFYDADWIEDDA